MIATKQMDLRANIKKYFDLAFNGEAVIVSRKQNRNVVVISEAEYNELQKAKRNAEYLAMLDKSMEQLEAGNTISFTMDEMKEMESDDWKPSKKIIDFMEKNKNEWFYFYCKSFSRLSLLADRGQENIEKIKDLNVNYISSGALTHSAPILDVSLKNLHPVD